MLAATAWPEPDESLAVDDEIEVGIQVNGKLRDTITIPRDCEDTDAKARALESPAILRYLDSNEPKNIIVVRNRVINIVI